MTNNYESGTVPATKEGIETIRLNEYRQRLARFHEARLAGDVPRTTAPAKVTKLSKPKSKVKADAKSKRTTTAKKRR